MMTGIVEFADKDLRAAIIINRLKDLKDNMNVMKNEMMYRGTRCKLQK